MAGVLRTDQDIGLLNNVRIAAEIATGVAFLTGRRLSMPFERVIQPAPRSSIDVAERGRPATLLDLFVLPVDIVHSDEWSDMAQHNAELIDWDRAYEAVCVCDDEVDMADPQLVDFANGRTRFLRPPRSQAAIVQLDGRLLSFYSYFFFAPPARRRQLHAVLQGVRPRRPYVEVASRIATGLGAFNALHLRRSDLTVGIPAYNDVTPEDVARNLEQLLDPAELLVVCSEVPGNEALFDPLRQRFSKMVFANDLILGDHRDEFFSLPRHEDNALGLITQQVAARANRFVGTMGSTFTALIHRDRLLRDPSEPFLYTADFTPPGAQFRNGAFQERQGGCYTWNRIGIAVPPDVLAWFREWPEAR